MSNVLVVGAGGFIGDHLVKRLIDDGHKIIAVDLKPLENWFQLSENATNLSLDLKDFNNCLKVTKKANFLKPRNPTFIIISSFLFFFHRQY